ncbi:MAG TPA: CAP domain-containing protein [Pyrinomonadaceae bacterium]|nr:CAP domain-containing protein [Pyrinomonadaceae bacterium]
MQPQQFPRTATRRVALTVLLSTAWLVALGLSTFAKGGTNNPKPTPAPGRPVARLLSTSDMVVGNRPRPRPVSTSRATSNAPARAAYAVPAYAAPVRAAVAVSATSEERRLFELVNAERRAKGMAPFELDGELMHVARLHSQNMARQGFFDHIGRDGRSVSGRADEAGLRGWRMIGENIAYNQGFDDPSSFAVERWMKSVKHRENILSRSYTRTGLGIARAADGRIFFTQVFMMR